MGNKKGTYQNAGAKESKKNIVLPEDSAKFVRKILNENWGDYKEENVLKINPFLSHNRFLQIIQFEKGKVYYKSILTPILEKRPVEEKEFCDEELSCIMSLANERNMNMANGFAGNLHDMFKPDKLIIGTGSSTPYGNVQMIRLHPIYGVPYIPATAIKGSIRSCWILEEFDGKEQCAEENAAFCNLFGSANDETGGQQGTLVFFDIFPNTFSIGLDVQSPHYSTGLTDDQSPVPIFYTCLINSTFEIFVACKDRTIWGANQEKMAEILKLALLQYGLGAKTALGYGIDKGTIKHNERVIS